MESTTKIYKNLYITNLKFLLNSYMMKFLVNIISDNKCNVEIMELHSRLINMLDQFYENVENNVEPGKNKQNKDELNEYQSSN